MTDKNPPPFKIDDRVTLNHRIDPFFSDDVLIVQSVSKIGRGKKTSWRVRCYVDGRDASGWVDADNLTAQTI